MENLTLIAAREKNLIASDQTFISLLEVDVVDDNDAIVETLRLVNGGESVIRNGLEYVAFPFSITLQYEAGGQPNLTLAAQDVTRDLQARMQQYGGMVNSKVRLLLMLESDLNIDPDLIEYFEVINSGSDDYAVSWTLGAENMLGRQFPSRRQLRDRCAWRYKSEECGYTGAIATCDYTLQGANGCRHHGNNLNFGGFPGLKGNGMRFG